MITIDKEVMRRALKQTREDRRLLNELVKIRKAKEASEGLTQDKVAKRMATNQSNISQLENGRTDIRRGTLRKYAVAIGVEITYKIKDLDSKPMVQPDERSCWTSYVPSFNYANHSDKRLLETPK